MKYVFIIFIWESGTYSVGFGIMVVITLWFGLAFLIIKAQKYNAFWINNYYSE